VFPAVSPAQAPVFEFTKVESAMKFDVEASVAIIGISNNAGPVKSFFCFFQFFCHLFSFFERTSPLTPKSGLVRLAHRCIDDHGSLIIFRSASVRPNDLFDPYCDHD
jgi:hypothetical protein